jgi:hypothetical protein
MKKFIVLVVMLSSVAHAAIVCEGTSFGKPAKVKITDTKVTVTSENVAKPHVFNKVEVSDNGNLITAKGFAATFSNNYGCIVNATIITEFREGYMEVMTVKKCSGGSTPDYLCKPKR